MIAADKYRKKRLYVVENIAVVLAAERQT